MTTQLHPIFASILAAHGMAMPKAPEVPAQPTTTLTVPLCDVCYTDDKPQDPEARWHEGTLTEEQTHRVYELLLSDADVLVKLDRLAERVAREGDRP